jgi:hypothetical protein
MTLDSVPGLALLVQLGPNDPRVVSPFAFLVFRRLRETCRWTAVKNNETKRMEAVVVFVATAIGTSLIAFVAIHGRRTNLKVSSDLLPVRRLFFLAHTSARTTFHTGWV